jgi:class 3 adenylate cyclase/DNA-binding NarL/FixJ family response regulator
MVTSLDRRPIRVSLGIVGAITVFLADDSVLIREGVRAMLKHDADVEVVGVAEDYQSLVEGAGAANPDVIVSDIRMPPNFQREGIDACKEIRKRHPGTGIVILSQYDDPDYAVTLLAEGAAGYAYLLKDRIAEGDQLARAIREVATGGSMLDPAIVTALVNPVRRTGGLSAEDDHLLGMVAAGKTIKAIATTLKSTPSAVDDQVERLFVSLAEGVSARQAGALERLKRLHQAIVEREEQGETLSRLLPTGVAETLLAGGHGIGETERLEVTVVMSDIRGFTTIAEYADPAVLAGQLNRHRAEMNRAILGHGGTVMQYVGDAVMAVFGAPVASADHADRALAAALAMHEAQQAVNNAWEAEGIAPFGLGIGLSTGVVAAALLGSDERVEYTLVGDSVNLCQRLQQFAEPGQTVLSEATWAALTTRPVDVEQLEPQLVKGRETPTSPFRLPAVPPTFAAVT